VQVLAEQLSREISLKEELAELLRHEREKLAQATLHLANANRANAELRKKIGKLEQESTQGDSVRSEYELKLNKYRDIVRKKDELLTKNQQKLEEFLKSERVQLEKEQEVRTLKEAVARLRAKEEATTHETAGLKKKNAEFQQQLE
jgi:hypothetical protein